MSGPGYVRSRDPLGVFYTWTPTIERFRGVSGRGEHYDDPVTDLLCQITLTSVLVVTTDGRQVSTTATLNTFQDAAPVPVGSRVTLPAALGGHPGRVAVEGVHDSGIAGVPGFYRFHLERPTVSR